MKTFIFLMLFTMTASGACTKPVAPILPNPEVAVTAQMIKAKNEIKTFIVASEAYLECVGSNDTFYNKMVEEMQQAADSFNAIVKKYKARMKT